MGQTGEERAMSKHLILILLVTCLFTPYGCATVTRGTTEAFLVESDPLGADVRLSSGEICKTPCTLEKKHNDKFVVFIEKEGYEKVEVRVTHKTCDAGAAGMAGNVILGGIIGAAVDAGSGATQELCPNPVKVALVPLQKSHDTPMVKDSIPDGSPSQNVTSTDLEDDLYVSKMRKFKQMNEEGLISNEEYEAIRRKLLGAELKDVTGGDEGFRPSENEVRPAAAERF